MEEVAEFVERMQAREAVARTAVLMRRLGALPEAASEETLRLIEAWLTNPQEPLRMEAWRRAERAEYGGVDGQLLASVAWTGGSMADPKVSHVPPPATLPAQAAANAIRLALAQVDPADNERHALIASTFPEVRLTPPTPPEEW